MAMLTDYEIVLLDLVRKGKGEWGWYQIERRLSNMDVPREPGAMTILKSLKGRGLVVRHVTPGQPNDRWEITDAGRAELEFHSSND
jgi:PadR family transcriptional regulator PadR